ncbi:MAG: RNA-binding S4 domain-containing protein [Tissierellia bacterium]|jgi:ribosome-associated protein|nr:RNA-binding S4 domain-containing protein [Bacillota bacterium]NLK59030.1 RNA-binding S4 domain-containing protein [Tissierellia bacterium]
MNTVEITTESIRLDQALKLAGITGTGGESKYLIQEGLVSVNQEEELRRGRKLHDKDIVEVQGDVFQIKRV